MNQGYGNDKQPRKYWKEGIIEECFESRDQVVRKVKIRYENGKTEVRVVQDIVVIKEIDEC